MAVVLARVSLDRRIGMRMMVAVAVYAVAMGVFAFGLSLWSF